MTLGVNRQRLNLATRCRLQVRLLEAIAERRERECDPNIGAAVERRIIDAALTEIERVSFDGAGPRRRKLLRILSFVASALSKGRSLV
jgi:hypothetical protein